MGGYREIPRTATFAWSPNAGLPSLVTGTKAGAVDEGFSNETQLELWDLQFDKIERGVELTPKASVATDARFNDIAWTRAGSSTHSQGIIAGALENGSLDLWNADKLYDGQQDKAFLSRTTKHSGPIKALQFNAFRSELLATVGAKGELFISDVNNIANPFRVGNSVARADDFDCLDWNKRTSHIMATGSSGGTMTVWDVKNKRESLTLNNLGRKPVSAVAWDPVKTTRLVTAIPNDTEPVILVWDLRNANAPERILKGHDGGILSLSWCHQDSDLLLSCGKDNRTICWNPQTGDAYGDLSVVTNWTFQTRWSSQQPNFSATASFDGKIIVDSIQNLQSSLESTVRAQNGALDDEDFFNKAQAQPQGSTFSLAKAPKWLEKPCGASFGFGGKIVTFKSSLASATDTSRRSTVRVSKYVLDESIVSSTQEFEESLKSSNLAELCEARADIASRPAEKADWKVLKALASNNTRKDLMEYLGFASTSSDDADVSDLFDDLSIDRSSQAAKNAANSDTQSSANGKRLSDFFENGPDSDNFLSELAASKTAKTNSPFKMYSGSESASDRKITQALLLGEFEKALGVCLAEGRLSDAFMIAICGGQSCIEKVQKAYFGQQEAGPNYLRLLASIVGKNLWDLVHNADLTNWKEIMATLCTYADSKAFPDLCEELGNRLSEGPMGSESSGQALQGATFCYLAGSKLEKVVKIWLQTLRNSETAEMQAAQADSAFSAHVHSLQSFIEKVTVFRQVTKFEDEQKAEGADWKLSSLYDRYIEYAELAAAYGKLHIAERYLELLPPKYEAAEVAIKRIKRATRQPAQQQKSAGQPQQTSRLGAAYGTNFGAVQQPAGQATLSQGAPVKPAMNSYAPQNTYAPSNHTPYAAPNGHGPTQTTFGPNHASLGQNNPGIASQGSAYGVMPTPRPLAPPPTTFNTQPAMPPPSKATNMGNWNDTPEEFFKPPTMSRRGTPAAVIANPIMSSQLNPSQQSIQQQPLAPPPRSTPPIGPPPKTSGPSSMSSMPPPPTPPAQQPVAAAGAGGPSERPQSRNQYMPQQSSLNTPTAATIPRGPSPYNAPPTQVPPNNRYTPTQPTQPTQSMGNNLQSRPDANQVNTAGTSRAMPAPPTQNPYAPQQNHSPVVPPNPYAPQQSPAGGAGAKPYSAQQNGLGINAAGSPGSAASASPAARPPPTDSSRAALGAQAAPPASTPGPVPGPGTSMAQSPAQSNRGGSSSAGGNQLGASSLTSPSLGSNDRGKTPSNASQAAAKPRHPSGDRTHIPSTAMPIYEILNTDMQRVKGRAPPAFKAQVLDTEKRLNILFDHLNNAELLKPDTINMMLELCQALSARNYDAAQAIHVDILTNKMDECGNWMVGVKRLIGMSRATP